MDFSPMNTSVLRYDVTHKMLIFISITVVIMYHLHRYQMMSPDPD